MSGMSSSSLLSIIDDFSPEREERRGEEGQKRGLLITLGKRGGEEEVR